MPTLTEIFEDVDASPKAFLQVLKPEALTCLTRAEQSALKAILKRQWEELRSEPVDASKERKARRGYVFERITFKLLALEGLAPSPPYYASPTPPGEDGVDTPRRRGRRPGGEQIDGAFVLDGRDFLVESKWQSEIPASEMYVFRGRVDGKLVGTIGVFISAEGFVKDAEYALISGKEVNVFLVDGTDLGLALEPSQSFRSMMRVKLREAARMGRAFFSYAEFLDTAEGLKAIL